MAVKKANEHRLSIPLLFWAEASGMAAAILAIRKPDMEDARFLAALDLVRESVVTRGGVKLELTYVRRQSERVALASDGSEFRVLVGESKP